MGVTGLWPILTPVMKHQSLSSLKGQTLAVDLSIWVCENQGVRQMQGRVLKPHIRNLFFRVSTLLQHGIRLVFVIEGEAPELKHQTMTTRFHTRYKSSAPHYSKKRFGRGKFRVFLKECCEVLDCLGVPYVQATGEAEGMCAALNAAGVVDACLSDDSDCFLYGAKVVFRNLTLDSKGPQVESYSMSDVTSDLGLTRENLVALALVLGCDYYQAGIPGVGDITAIKLMTTLATFDILKRFKQWKHMTASDCIDGAEVVVWRKASSLPDFPPEKVIEEFLSSKEKVPIELPQWQRPCIMKVLTLCTRYLDWPEQYSLEKALPLVTLWDQLDIMQPSCQQASQHLIPIRIIKRRVKQRNPCFEVEWENPIQGLVNDTQQQKTLVTLEQENRFQICFPALVESFTQHTEHLKAARPKRGQKTKIKKDEDNLVDDMDALLISTGSTDYKLATLLSCDSYSGFSSQSSNTHFNQSSASVDRLIPEMPLPSHHPSKKTVKDKEKGLSLQDSSDSSDVMSACRQKQNCPGFKKEKEKIDVNLSDSSDDFVDFDKLKGNYLSATTEYPQPHASSGAIDKAKNRSVVDRRVEYIPLGQRIAVLSRGKEEVNECTEVVDLDDSYTYIPLCQRLKARLSSKEKESSMAFSIAATIQHTQKSETSCDSTIYEKQQSQELNSECQDVHWEEQSSSLLNDDLLQVQDTSNDRGMNCKQQLPMSNVQVTNTDEQKAYSDDGSTCSIPTTLNTMKIGTDCSTTHTNNASVTMVAVGTGPENSSNSWKCGKFHYETGNVRSPNITHSACGQAVHVSYSLQCETVAHEKFCTAYTKKQYPEKQTETHQKGQEALAFSKNAKKAVNLSGLLDNWSDSDCNENSDAENDSLLGFVHFNDERGLNNISCRSAVQNSDCSVMQEKRCDNLCFLSENECAPCTTSSMPSGSDSQHTSMIANQTKSSDVACDASSFVSDGHFTLQHSLFASLVDLDLINESSTSDSSAQLFVPESGTSLQVEIEAHKKNLTTYGASVESVQKSFQTYLVPDSPVTKTDYALKSHTRKESDQVKAGPTVMDGGLAVPGSSTTRTIEDGTERKNDYKIKAFSQMLGSTNSENEIFDDFGDDSSHMFDQAKQATGTLPMPSKISRNSTKDETESSSAVCKSSEPVKHLEKESSGNKPHSGNEDIDLDISFLPLSQRLRLKKPNSKLLTGLDDM